MNLLLLAPDIQEAILFLPPIDGRRASIGEHTLRPIFALPDWRKQRGAWGELVGPGVTCGRAASVADSHASCRGQALGLETEDDA